MEHKDDGDMIVEVGSRFGLALASEGFENGVSGLLGQGIRSCSVGCVLDWKYAAEPEGRTGGI